MREVLEETSVFDCRESREAYRVEGGKRMEGRLSSRLDKTIKKKGHGSVSQSNGWKRSKCQIRPGGLEHKRYTFIVS